MIDQDDPFNCPSILDLTLAEVSAIYAPFVSNLTESRSGKRGLKTTSCRGTVCLGEPSVIYGVAIVRQLSCESARPLFLDILTV